MVIDGGLFDRVDSRRRTAVGSEITIKYDEIGDILSISKCSAYMGQDEDEIDDEVVVRFNRESGEIENLHILFFKARLEKDGEVRLPVDAVLRSSQSAISSD